MRGEPTDRTETHPAHLYLDVNDMDATYRRALEAGRSRSWGRWIGSRGTETPG